MPHRPHRTFAALAALTLVLGGGLTAVAHTAAAAPAGPALSTPAISPSVSPTVTRPPSGVPTVMRGGCRATLRVVSSWPGGFQGEVSVTPTTSFSVHGWSTSFRLPADGGVAAVWNGVHTASEDVQIVRSTTWNGYVAPGDVVTYGFVATGGVPAEPYVSCSAPGPP